MCYDDQARPPIPPGAAGQTHGEELVLTASDGNRFSAFMALPAQAASRGEAQKAVLIYPDIRGLHQFYRELALRFAEVGIPALAMDYFGRTAGLTSRAEGFEFRPHVEQLRGPTLLLDVQAALAHLREKLGAHTAVFVVGFCLGGSLTLLTGTNRDLGFAGLIPFYAGLNRNMGSGSVLDNAPRVAYPVEGFFGGADQGIPESDVHTLEQRLGEAGVPRHITIYPGAPHSFFDRRSADFADASADAWQRLLTFIRSYQPQTV
jgi:carboxymethylenebutenolidase